MARDAGPSSRSLRWIAVATVVVCAGACATQRVPLYRWGPYESILYSMWIEPGTADPVDAGERLATDLRAAEAAGARVPPGVHAHLGWLYWLQGLQAEARAEFAAERALFPESATLIDDMIARMDGVAARPQASAPSDAPEAAADGAADDAADGSAADGSEADEPPVAGEEVTP